MDVRGIELLTKTALLGDLLEEEECFPDGPASDTVTHVRTFVEAGVQTKDAGLVLHMGDGAEFRVTIVQSRASR